MKTLVIVGHPNLPASRVSRSIIEEIKTQANSDITLHVLWEAYPDYKIDIKKEQDLLMAHEKVVFVFPTQWYAVPALLKKWQEDVLVAGFAYGDGGDKLKGKQTYFISSTAGDSVAYSASGYNNYPIIDFFKPFEQTFRLCSMDLREPIFFQGVYQRPEADIATFAKTAYEYIVKNDVKVWSVSS